MSKFRAIFKDKNFFCFWIGQVVSQFGDRLNQMALIFIVSSRFSGSSSYGLALAKVISFTIIPSFLISPLAGALVDRWNRKYTMIISDLIRAALVLFIPLVLKFSDSFVPIYCIVFLIFSTSCFFLPSKFSIIPQIVDKEKLLIANSLTNITIMIAAVLGVGLGGALIEKSGAVLGFYIDAFTYLISACLLFFVRTKDTVNGEKVEGNKKLSLLFKSIWGEIKEGISYIRGNPYLRFVFFTIFILMSAAGAVSTVTVIFIQNVFSSVTRDLGFLSFFLGAGFFLGTLICGRFAEKVSKVKVIFFGLIASGFFLSCFAVFLKIYPSMVIAGILTILLGAAVGPIFISVTTLIHEVAKTKMGGRTFSSLGIVMNLGFLLFMFIASLLLGSFPPGMVIVIVSGGFLFYGILGLIYFRGKR
ncbi:MAG: MFS transporter [Candidatus Omnitrophica bacterium]|nr:MFS transporter [Candidatus Omnitrophota bacterium]